MQEPYSIQLSKIIDEFNLEVLYLPNLPQDITIGCSRVNRPGLQVAANYYDYYERERLQIIGKMESEFLMTLSAEQTSQRLETFFSSKPAGDITSLSIFLD